MTLFDPEPLVARRPPEAGPGETEESGAGSTATGSTETGSTETGPVARGERATTRLRLTVAYDGAGFRGFAAQPGQRTVAGVLAEAIATAVGHPVELVCAGRTDAGVHAVGQVVHTDVARDVDPARLQRSLNAMMGPQVVVRHVDPAPDDFDARRSARARRYRYLIPEAPVPDPLLSPTTWHVVGPLDLRAMQSAADAVLGEHDFRAFCRRVPGTAAGTPIVRRVLDATVAAVGLASGDLDPGARLLRLDVTATSFCHQMVRSLAGVLVEVGRGRRRVADVTAMLRQGDRSRSGGVIAPPQGLCLVGVDYDG